MAGDCPHSAHLEASLKHCHDSSDVMAATHKRYLKIIDELKNDLEQMSCEVVKVQNECTGPDQVIEDDGVDLETSLKALETQNDRLEQALLEQSHTKDAALMELQTNNEHLKCQILDLRKAVIERDQSIGHLETILARLTQKHRIEPPSPHSKALEYGSPPNECCSGNKRIVELQRRIDIQSKELDKSQRQERFLQSETRKLNAELNDSKRKNGDLVTQAHRLAGLIKDHKAHHLQLASKYDSLEQNFEDQAKKLRTANAQLATLNERFQMMEKLQAENKMERDLLRNEVLALKEKEAVVMGRQKSVQEQLLKTDKELYAAHDVIKEQQSSMHRAEVAHADALRHLKDENCELKRNLTSLVEDYKQLEEECEKERNINNHYEKLFESFKKWKESQLKAEVKTREHFRQYEEHIQLLLKEKKESLEQHRCLHQNYLDLQIQLENLKKTSYSFSQPNTSQCCVERSMAERLDLIRRTTLRLSEQSACLQASTLGAQRSSQNTPAAEAAASSTQASGKFSEQPA